MNIDLINSNFRTDCSEENYKNKLIDKLKNDYGFTDDDISDIDDELNIISKTIVLTQSDLDALGDSEYEQILKDVSEESNNQLINITSIQEEVITSSLEDAYISKYENDNIITDSINNSKEEDTYYKEPIVSPKVSSNFNIDDSHYSLLEDYPNSYGFRDFNGNYFKVNLTKNQIDFVHNSGTLIKIDKNGNVTLNIAGSLKHIVNGDYILKVNGNLEQQIGGQLYITSGGDKTEVIGGNNIRKAGGSDITKASGILHN
jgi:hypothetical protein